MKLEGEKALSILTEQEKKVMTMRDSGMSFAAIGGELGMTPSSARYYCQKACKTWYRYQAYYRYLEYNSRPIEFPLTREELALIKDAVKQLEMRARGKRIPKVPKNRNQHSEFEYLLLKDLLERIEMALHESEPAIYSDALRRIF